MNAKRLLLAGAIVLVLPLSRSVVAQDQPVAEPAEKTPAESPEQLSAPLHGRQEAISQRFKRFERLLEQMAEYMRKTDPAQADLLIRAIGQSKSDRISSQMGVIARLLENDDLGSALDREEQVIESLKDLIALLRSGDRLDELKNEQARIRDLLKDLDRVTGLHKDARASNERGDPTDRAVDRQEAAAQGAQNLLDKIDGQDAQRGGKAGEGKDGEGKTGEGKEGEGKEGKAGEGKESEDKAGEGKEGEGKEGKPGEGKEGEGKAGEGKEGEGKEGKPGENKAGEGKEGKQGENKDGESQEGEGKPGEGKPGEGKPGEGKPGEGQPGEGQPGEGKPGEGQQGESSQSQQSDQNKTAGRDDIEKALDRMNRAIEELKKQSRDGASEEQSKALAHLEEAKAKLEEILRQLREEERELLLAALEARFAKMLQMQLMVNTGTLNLDKTPKEQWTSSHQGRSRELAQIEDEIALEAVKALDLLKEEGSSVAFPEAIAQVRQDMLTVAGNLERSDVGELTQAIEADIVEALSEVIEALQKEMEKGDEKKSEPKDGQPQDPALVDQLAELKMLRSLQARVNRRTKLLARKFRGEQADDPQVVRQLQELSRRQSRIQETAYDLATGRNK